MLNKTSSNGDSNNTSSKQLNKLSTTLRVTYQTPCTQIFKLVIKIPKPIGISRESCHKICYWGLWINRCKAERKHKTQLDTFQSECAERSTFFKFVRQKFKCYKLALGVLAQIGRDIRMKQGEVV